MTELLAPLSAADHVQLAGWAGEVLQIKQAEHGLGTPFASKSIGDIVAILKYQNFAIFCNGIAMASLKVGIGVALLRIRLGKSFNIAIWCAIALSCIVNLTVFGGCFAKCQPIQKIWNRSVSGTCWPAWGDLISSYGQTGKQQNPRSQPRPNADHKQVATLLLTCSSLLVHFTSSPESRCLNTTDGHYEACS